MPLQFVTDTYDSKSTNELNDNAQLCLHEYERTALAQDINTDAVLQFAKGQLLDFSNKYYDLLRPLQTYWCVSALTRSAPLDRQVWLTPELQKDIAKSLTQWSVNHGSTCIHPLHYPHTMATFGAVLTAAVIGDYSAFDKGNVLCFLQSVKCSKTGGFRTTLDGEVDSRSTYAAVVIGYCTGLIAGNPDLFGSTVISFLKDCQCYDGGFAASAAKTESHSAYCYCSIAALFILLGCDAERLHAAIDVPRLGRFIANRQQEPEGGFNGRPNKLVDACYSFWLTATVSILCGSPHTSCFINEGALQRYLIHCCQDDNGGLRDKPGASADAYHTCYGLSGYLLSLALEKRRHNTLHAPSTAFNVDFECVKQMHNHFQMLDNAQR